MRPRVSIVMSVRDDVRRLPGTIASIRSQSFEDWELIVVDDGSLDGSLAAAEELAARDSRIRVISGPRAGIAPSRNLGMSSARGEWFAVADSDDRWHPEKLAKQLAFLEVHPGVELIGSFGYRVSSAGKRLGIFDLGPRSIEEFRDLQRSATPVGLIHASVVFHRRLFDRAGGYPEDYPVGIDLAYINLRLAPQTNVMAMSDRLVSIEVRPDSIQRRNVDHAVDAYDSVALNLRRRLEGLPELSYRASVEALAGGSLLSRLERRRIRARHRHYTQGASRLSAGSTGGGLLHLAAAFVVAPLYTTRRLASQIVPLAIERLRGDRESRLADSSA